MPEQLTPKEFSKSEVSGSSLEEMAPKIEHAVIERSSLPAHEWVSRYAVAFRALFEANEERWIQRMTAEPDILYKDIQDVLNQIKPD